LRFPSRKPAFDAVTDDSSAGALKVTVRGQEDQWAKVSIFDGLNGAAGTFYDTVKASYVDVVCRRLISSQQCRSSRSLYYPYIQYPWL